MLHIITNSKNDQAPFLISPTDLKSYEKKEGDLITKFYLSKKDKLLYVFVDSNFDSFLYAMYMNELTNTKVCIDITGDEDIKRLIENPESLNQDRCFFQLNKNEHIIWSHDNNTWSNNKDKYNGRAKLFYSTNNKEQEKDIDLEQFVKQSLEDSKKDAIHKIISKIYNNFNLKHKLPNLSQNQYNRLSDLLIQISQILSSK